eukprot:CAMPEP_0206305356 /NCGR_PEP_ID=MMETSP0106_2-20121207/10221_1 /ASSEMBLY_ACC=CAM_ASM_000206 /TAXON_ID=81532 /ORGANISM="Acanthoeca-like sp., Strain 10tr" /LENGTH=64 /DNA_ID=CAMNT_0053736201 /DNA_START=246 /DNA_END=444 /DNA_ORIENTATION=-
MFRWMPPAVQNQQEKSTVDDSEKTGGRTCVADTRFGRCAAVDLPPSGRRGITVCHSHRENPSII